MRHKQTGDSQIKQPSGAHGLGILTKRQADILKYIATHHIVKRRSPTLKEIADKFSIGTNGVVGHLSALKKKGWIAQDQFVARSIVLSKDLACETCGGCGISSHLLEFVNNAG